MGGPIFLQHLCDRAVPVDVLAAGEEGPDMEVDDPRQWEDALEVNELVSLPMITYVCACLTIGAKFTHNRIPSAVFW
jgi:hypothetical protein